MKIYNYYSILNLSKDSSCDDLYKECRILFFKYHPSTDNSEDAFKMFIFVNDAYSVLLDEEIRSKYDYLLSKYSENIPIKIEDKKKFNYILNLIKNKRKGIKEMSFEKSANMLIELHDIPLLFSNEYSASGRGNIFEGISFSDIDLSTDIDFNLFDFIDLN